MVLSGMCCLDKQVFADPDIFNLRGLLVNKTLTRENMWHHTSFGNVRTGNAEILSWYIVLEQNLWLTIIISNSSKDSHCDKVVRSPVSIENEHTGRIVSLLKGSQHGLLRKSHGLVGYVLQEDHK